jgi:hypothetical protein
MTKYIITVICIFLMGVVMIINGDYVVECRDILYISSIIMAGWIAEGDG